MRRYPKIPLVGVGAVIVENGKILLVKRANEPNKGKWSVPGGLVRSGEKLKEALKREIREELGVEIETGDVAWVTDEIYFDRNGRVEYHYIVIDLFARIVDGVPKAMSDADEVRWFDLSKINDVNTVDFVDRLAKKLLSDGDEIYIS